MSEQTMTPLQAFNALIAGKFQRYCVPGKWRVYWENGRARVEFTLPPSNPNLL